VPALQDAVSIEATVKRVFAYLSDIERVPEWLPNVVEAGPTDGTASGLDAEIEIVMAVGGRKHRGFCRCTEWDEPNRLVLEAVLDAGVTSTIAFDLERDGRQHTTLSTTIDYTMPGGGLGRLVGGLVGDRMARRDMQTALQNLKAQIEASKPQRRPRRSAPTP
jgi:uncharacterized membrane protein